MSFWNFLALRNNESFHVELRCKRDIRDCGRTRGDFAGRVEWIDNGLSTSQRTFIKCVSTVKGNVTLLFRARAARYFNLNVHS